MKLNKPLIGANFFAGDVAGGIGPYLAIYLLAIQHWSPSQIGVALALGSITTVIAQAPAGVIIDATKWKRYLLIGCAAAIAVSTLSIIFFRSDFVVYAAQMTIGLSSAFLGPSLAALTLGLVGHEMFTRQTSANQAWNHAGNMFAASVSALVALTISELGVFWLVAMMAMGMIVCVLAIRETDIDHELARGGEQDDAAGEKKPVSFLELFEDRRLLIFAVSILLFHFANASMLPLVSQKLSLHSDAKHGIAFTSACVVTAQLVMTIMAIFCGWKADSWGRKPLLLIAFAVLPVRGALFAIFDDSFLTVAVQALDGVANGIFAMIFVLVIADITKGTGRFNFAQGTLATIVGIGASASNLVAEAVVEATSYDFAFMMLAGIAAVGLVIFALFMEETAPHALRKKEEASADAAGS